MLSKHRVKERSFFLVISASLFFMASPAHAALHLVTNTSASGAGSLDNAVAAANADGDATVQIGFNLPANSTISLTKPLFLQKSMTISSSTSFAAGASNLTITNPTSAAFLAGARPNPSISTVTITFDGNNGSNGLTVTGTSTGGVGGGAGLGGERYLSSNTRSLMPKTPVL